MNLNSHSRLVEHCQAGKLDSDLGIIRSAVLVIERNDCTLMLFALLSMESYLLAQRAIADLKAAVLSMIEKGPGEGLTNAEIGRSLGIYAGHVGHEGHISRTLLSMLESEGLIKQDIDSKRWSLATGLFV